MKAFRPVSRSFLSSPCRLYSSAARQTSLASSLPTQRQPFSRICQKTYQHRGFVPVPRRFQSSSAPATIPSSTNVSAETVRADEPAYAITFTCKPCSTRSTHRMSKQGYHYGAVLIQCPGCRNRHVMSDHLGIFTEKGQGGTLDDILAKYGRGEEQHSTLKKGFVDGDLEFWDDGTVKQRKEQTREEELRTGQVARLPPRKSIDLGNKK